LHGYWRKAVCAKHRWVRPVLDHRAGTDSQRRPMGRADLGPGPAGRPRAAYVVVGDHHRQASGRDLTLIVTVLLADYGASAPA
jgi:hypothetical protein